MRLHLGDVQAVYELLTDLGPVALWADAHQADGPGDLAQLPDEDAREIVLAVPRSRRRRHARAWQRIAS